MFRSYIDTNSPFVTRLPPEDNPKTNFLEKIYDYDLGMPLGPLQGL